RAFAAVGRLHHRVRVRRGAVADDLAIDVRAALLRGLQLLEDQDAGALGDDEAVAPGVERPRRARRLLVARRERAHGVEAADAERRDGRLAAAGEHGVAVAALNRAHGLA